MREHIEYIEHIEHDGSTPVGDLESRGRAPYEPWCGNILPTSLPFCSQKMIIRCMSLGMIPIAFVFLLKTVYACAPSDFNTQNSTFCRWNNGTNPFFLKNTTDTSLEDLPFHLPYGPTIWGIGLMSAGLFCCCLKTLQPSDKTDASRVGDPSAPCDDSAKPLLSMQDQDDMMETPLETPLETPPGTPPGTPSAAQHHGSVSCPARAKGSLNAPNKVSMGVGLKPGDIFSMSNQPFVFGDTPSKKDTASAPLLKPEAPVPAPTTGSVNRLCCTCFCSGS